MYFGPSGAENGRFIPQGFSKKYFLYFDWVIVQSLHMIGWISFSTLNKSYYGVEFNWRVLREVRSADDSLR
jgi:hypothetical protein